jgi:SSS family solute:Na+ symporter
MWFSISAIASGGLAGLFLLAFLSARATRQGVYIGIVASILFTAWATLTSQGDHRLLDLGRFNYPWNDLVIGAGAHVTLLVTGYLASLFFPRDPGRANALTLWEWLRMRKTLASETMTGTPVSH